MNKVLKVISNILLIIVIIILSGYLILKFTNKIAIYEVMSGSMETGIHKGDYIVVKKDNHYNIDDVVTYIRDNHYITHRIVKINGDKIITKGDANNTEDEEINKSDIVGKYVFRHEILNFIIDYKFLIVAMILILFIITSVLSKNDNELEDNK